MTEVSPNEVAMKQAMMRRCRQVIGILDSSKWGRVSAITFASIDEVDKIISDAAAPAHLVDRLRQQQVEVILV